MGHSLESHDLDNGQSPKGNFTHNAPVSETFEHQLKTQQYRLFLIIHIEVSCVSKMNRNESP
jgi:hypothetical protein